MIEVQNVSKFFGNFPAVEDVSFKVEKGEILGLLGPNGAGKTTTMRIITGYMPPTSGTVRVDGHDILHDSMAARQAIGYLPETVPLYTDMTVREYLLFQATIRGVPNNKKAQRLEDVVETVRLNDYVDTHIGKLSKGFRQRVGIAQAIIHDPSVLVLDEPTIGIDPIQVVETRSLIKSLGGANRAVILSTHILPEVSMVCGRVVIINEGRVIAEDTPANLAQRLQNSRQISVDVRGPTRQVTAVLEKIPGVTSIHRESFEGHSQYIVECAVGNDCREELAKAVVANGWGLLSMQAKGMTLEEVFLELTTQEEA